MMLCYVTLYYIGTCVFFFFFFFFLLLLLFFLCVFFFKSHKYCFQTQVAMRDLVLLVVFLAYKLTTYIL